MIETLELNEVLGVLQQGGVVAVETDTVWGLASLGAIGMERLFEMKGRSKEKPIVYLIHSIEQIKKWVEINGLTEQFFDFWPGALTLILPIHKKVLVDRHKHAPTFPEWLDLFIRSYPIFNQIGFRIPACKKLMDLLVELDQPLMVTSANSSGEVVLKTPVEIDKMWGEQVGGYWFEAGLEREDTATARLNISSTIVEVATKAKVLREGVGVDQIKKAINKWKVR